MIETVVSGLIWSAGVVVIVVTLYDFLSTALTVTGGGPVSSRLNASVWSFFTRLHGLGMWHAKLAGAGPILAVATLLLWASASWLGWTLAFWSHSGAVVNAQTMQPATFLELAYFTGFTLTTLGMGDFQPIGSGWRIATVLLSANGLFMFTMAISYIVPIVSAIASKRSLAAYCHRLGHLSTDVVLDSWDGKTFNSVAPHLVALTQLVDEVAQQYLAYPILNYFHSPEPDTALSVRIAVLDDALSILCCGVQTPHQLPRQTVEPLRRSIAGLLSILHSSRIESAENAPPVVSLASLADSRIPVVEQSVFERRISDLHERRCRLKALIKADGWQRHLCKSGEYLRYRHGVIAMTIRRGDSRMPVAINGLYGRLRRRCDYRRVTCSKAARALQRMFQSCDLTRKLAWAQSHALE